MECKKQLASKALLTKFSDEQRPTKLFCNNYSTKTTCEESHLTH
jgi:hypothetical protein